METAKDLVTKLQEEATKNPAFSAVCHLFAQRERARQQVTVASLSRAMQRNGFEFSKDDYRQVLARLATLGVGTVDRDPKQRLRSLKGIRVKLQSVGKAAIEGGSELKALKTQVRFKDLPAMQEAPKPGAVSKRVKKMTRAAIKGIRKQAEVVPQDATPTEGSKLIMAVIIGGERIQFELPVKGLKLSK